MREFSVSISNPPGAFASNHSVPGRSRALGSILNGSKIGPCPVSAAFSRSTATPPAARQHRTTGIKVYSDVPIAEGGTGTTTNASGTGALQFTTDLVNSALDTTFSNSPKDTQETSAWQWSLKSVSADKSDLEHGMAAAYLDTGYAATYGTAHTLIYVGVDRYSAGSNSAISIWFLQNPIGTQAGNPGTFINKKRPGHSDQHRHRECNR